MEPCYINYQGSKGYQIIHKCLNCGKKIPNITADDDNLELIAGLMHNQNIIPPSRKYGRN